MAKKKSKKNQKQVEFASPPAKPIEEPSPAVPDAPSLSSEPPATSLEDQSETPKLPPESKNDAIEGEEFVPTQGTPATDLGQTTSSEEKDVASVVPEETTSEEATKEIEAKTPEEQVVDQGEPPVVEPIEIVEAQTTEATPIATEIQTEPEAEISLASSEEQTSEHATTPENEKEQIITKTSQVRRSRCDVQQHPQRLLHHESFRGFWVVSKATTGTTFEF